MGNFICSTMHLTLAGNFGKICGSNVIQIFNSSQLSIKEKTVVIPISRPLPRFGVSDKDYNCGCYVVASPLFWGGDLKCCVKSSLQMTFFEFAETIRSVLLMNRSGRMLPPHLCSQNRWESTQVQVETYQGNKDGVPHSSQWMSAWKFTKRRMIILLELNTFLHPESSSKTELLQSCNKPIWWPPVMPWGRLTKQHIHNIHAIWNPISCLFSILPLSVRVLSASIANSASLRMI